MGAQTKISWCHRTFNVVWGCTKVSEACTHCYAETFSKRVGLQVWGADAHRRVLSDNYWKQPDKWNAIAQAAGERHRVFCSSMADVFEDHPTVADQRERLWPLIERTPWLDWLLLTKRPENMRKFTPESWGGGRFARDESTAGRWPSNVWAGCTAENQRRLEERAMWLLDVPASVLFLSCEPLLGELDLENVEPDFVRDRKKKSKYDPMLLVDCLRGHVKGPDDMLDRRISWVIAGFESGPKRRPTDLAWVRKLRDQCGSAGAAFFFKQTVDERGRKTELPELDGRRWAEFPQATSGGDRSNNE
jgi:protein gp37